VRRPELADAIQRDRENKEYLPGFPLPPEIEVASDPAVALSGAELLVAAFPTVHLRATANALAPHIPAHVPVVSVAKGLEQGTFLRPSEMRTNLWGPRPVAALCGPSHAEELARSLVAFDDQARFKCVASLLGSPGECFFPVEADLDAQGTRSIIELHRDIGDDETALVESAVVPY